MFCHKDYSAFAVYDNANMQRCLSVLCHHMSKPQHEKRNKPKLGYLVCADIRHHDVVAGRTCCTTNTPNTRHDKARVVDLSSLVCCRFIFLQTVPEPRELVLSVWVYNNAVQLQTQKRCTASAIKITNAMRFVACLWRCDADLIKNSFIHSILLYCVLLVRKSRTWYFLFADVNHKFLSKLRTAYAICCGIWRRWHLILSSRRQERQSVYAISSFLYFVCEGWTRQ